MTIERKVKFLGKEIRRDELKPGPNCYTLEEHAIYLGPIRHAVILSDDEIEVTELDLRLEKPLKKIYVKEAINGKINNSGDIFSRVIKIDYTWKPSGSK